MGINGKLLINDDVIGLMLEAGKLALGRREKKQLIVEVKGGDDNWVTNAEKGITELLQKSLVVLLPNWLWVSEEGENVYSGHGKELVIDEIDGTNNYVNNETDWAVSLGFVDDGQPVAGIVYLPDKDLLVWAEQDFGAWVLQSGSKTVIERVSSHSVVGQARGTFDYTYSQDARELRWTKNAAGELLHKVKSLSKFICQVVDVLEIVFGRAEFFFHLKTKPWDMAAVLAISKYVGAKAFGLDGRPYQLGNEQILITNRQLLADELLPVINSAKPE